MIYDYFRKTGANDTVLDYADLLSVTLHDESKIPSDDILPSLYKLRIRESAQLKNRNGIVRHGDSSEDIGSQLSKVENHGEEETETFGYETLTKGPIGVEGGKGISYLWKEKRPVFARRPMHFPSRNPRSCAKTRTHCRHAS